MTDGARRAGVRFLVLLSVLCPAAAIAESRVALVMGNASYMEAPLRNPLNDALDMAQALRDLGFDVIEVRDASRKGMIEAFNAFAERVQQAQVGLFYYSGHGVQIDGTNYLIPLHTQISDPADLEQETVALSRILGRMDRSQTTLNIVILDACRNNPFRALRAFRNYGGGGLARSPSVRSSLIAYATQPDNVAADGTGRNGTYTKHLLRHIKQPGLSLPDLFSEVGRAVLQETHNKQEPWVSFSPLPRFCLAGCEPSSVAVAAPLPNPPLPAPPPPPQPPTPAPAPQASLPPPSTAASTQERSRIGGASIVYVNVQPSLSLFAVGVSSPPPGDAVILINDKDVSALLKSEQPTSFSKTYMFTASPDQLNLVVGQNRLVMKYGDIALPAFDFRFTEQQKEEGRRPFGRTQPRR